MQAVTTFSTKHLYACLYLKFTNNRETQPGKDKYGKSNCNNELFSLLSRNALPFGQLHKCI